MKENIGLISGIFWFSLVLFLAVAMFIFAAIFVVFKSVKSGLKLNKIELPSITFPRFAK